MKNDVQAILAKRYPSFHEPFHNAFDWNRTGANDDAAKKLAEELCRGLKERYPNVLPIRYELAFSLVRQGKPAEAIAEMTQAAGEFPILDEDCRCLLGRCHKDEGDRLLKDGFIEGAKTEYRKAEEEYLKAYEISGDYFPGINVAALRLIRASLLSASEAADGGGMTEAGTASEELLRKAKEIARLLTFAVARTPKRTVDEDVWVWATRGDAYLILNEWKSAAESYRMALKEPGKRDYHPISINTQVHRLLAAFERLGIKPDTELADPDAFFGITQQP